MKVNIAHPVSKFSLILEKAILLCLLFSFVISACALPATEIPTSTSLPTSTSIPVPTIVPGGACEGAVGVTMPLSVTGIPGTGVVYRWTVSSGNVDPSVGPVVNYIPDTPGKVIIRVEAEMNGVTSDSTIQCTITGPTPTPTIVATLAPTLSPIPTPTSWDCTSFRSQKLQGADIPGRVTIDTPQQGTTDIPSGKEVQVGGSYTGIPEGKYLWVFIYSAEAGLHGRYYPQTKTALKGWQPDPTTGQDGRWALKVNFGAPNLCYEIIVILADKTASQSIADQLKSWDAVKNYAGYELNGPATADPPDAPGFPAGLVEKASIEIKTK